MDHGEKYVYAILLIARFGRTGWGDDPQMPILPNVVTKITGGQYFD